MSRERTQHALLISADLDVQDGLKDMLRGTPWRLITALSHHLALQRVETTRPSLILIDTTFAEEEQRHIAAVFKDHETLARKPVLLLTAEKGPEGRIAEWVLEGQGARRVTATREELLGALREIAEAAGTGAEADEPVSPLLLDGRFLHPDFGHFKKLLAERYSPGGGEKDALARVTKGNPYELAGILGLTERDLAGLIAEYLRLPHSEAFPIQGIDADRLPLEFCRFNSVVPVFNEAGEPAFLVGNPFDWELLTVLGKNTPADRPLRLLVSEPAHIRYLLERKPGQAELRISMLAGGESRADEEPERAEEEIPVTTTVIEDMGAVRDSEIQERPVIYISNNILHTAVLERVSDIHIEPKERETVVRFRIDGDLRNFFSLKKQTGSMVISRFKALARLDITERQKPQDGALEALINKRMFKFRLATTSTPNGESLIIRVLEPGAKPKELTELGMTDAQVGTMLEFSVRRQGLILVVGPTGAGKTTTIYSFLSHVDTRSRSLITVEDPVEYRIPEANQQQVNEKAGVTFEALLKSSVRQDPDILYMGEVRDGFSAKVCIDFASTGHVAVSTLHTNNATTAIFRLERLGVGRDVMAEALLGVIAQRLLKKLCAFCKRIEPITDREAEILGAFTNTLPSHVAHAVGCAKCRNGYSGREGVYEIIAFDPELLERIRTGMPISELREFLLRRGDYLIGNHTVEKVKEHLFPVQDAYEKVLVEEIRPAARDLARKPADGGEAKKPGAVPSILVVDDDLDNRLLVSRILANQGYEISLANDGIDALMLLAQKKFALIISDVNMPNLDGFKFLDIINQKGIQAPLMFLTSRTEEADEVRGLELGALEYLKKPVNKEALLLRVKRVLGENALKQEVR